MDRKSHNKLLSRNVHNQQNLQKPETREQTHKLTPTQIQTVSTTPKRRHLKAIATVKSAQTVTYTIKGKRAQARTQEGDSKRIQTTHKGGIFFFYFCSFVDLGV